MPPGSGSAPCFSQNGIVSSIRPSRQTRVRTTSAFSPTVRPARSRRRGTRRRPRRRELAPPRAQATVILVEVGAVELNAGQRRNPPVGGPEELRHRQVHARMRRVVVVKGQPWRRRHDGIDVRDERLDRRRLEVVRRDDRDRVGAGVLGVRGQLLAVADRERADVRDDQQAPPSAPDPFLHDRLALGDRARHAFAGGAADERAAHAVLHEQVGLLPHEGQVHVTVPIERRKRGGDEAREPPRSPCRGGRFCSAGHGTLQVNSGCPCVRCGRVPRGSPQFSIAPRPDHTPADDGSIMSA